MKGFESKLESIGYMQVHLRLYKNNEIYDTCAINAFNECYRAETQLISIEHQVVDDQSKIHEHIFQIRMEIPESDMTFLVHMPIHQSDEWEVMVLNDMYILGFYCTLGELNK